MPPRNGRNTDPTGFYPPDDPDVDEQALLADKTDDGIEKLSRLQVFWNDTLEVAQRNEGLLLVAAGEAFFAMTDAIVKTLQKVDPPVATLQVRLQSKLPAVPIVQTYATQAHGHSNVNHIHRLYDTHVRLLSTITRALCSHPLNRFMTKIPDPFIGPKDVRGLLFLRGIGGYSFSKYTFALGLTRF